MLGIYTKCFVATSKKKSTPADTINAVAYDGYTEVTPKAFWEHCNDDRELLGVEIQHLNVVEIDDGLSPRCFFKADSGYRVLALFNTAAARKNPRQKKTKEDNQNER